MCSMGISLKLHMARYNVTVIKYLFSSIDYKVKTYNIVQRDCIRAKLLALHVSELCCVYFGHHQE